LTKKKKNAYELSRYTGLVQTTDARPRRDWWFLKFFFILCFTSCPSSKAYLVNVLQQINDWLMAKSLQKLVLVITAVGSKEVLER